MLNLPVSIPGKLLTNTYDAAGAKLRKLSGSTTTEYIDGIQYTGTTMDFVQTEEGRILSPTGTPNYEYTLTDHLGNSRVIFDSSHGGSTALQTDDYYPFGMIANQPTVTSPPNHYLYNKKELQDELGQYDYGARFYDPVIGRWTSVDPLAEKSRRFSPYNYGENNPIRNIDPDGMATMSPIYDSLTGAFLGNDSQGFKGDILFADKSVYNKLSANGPIDHGVAEKSFMKINESNLAGNIAMVFGGSGIDLKAVSGAYTDILSKSGFNTNQLYNGAVSINYDKGGLTGGYNSPDIDNYSQAISSANWNGSGKANVTAEFTKNSGGKGNEALTYFTTVENVQEGLGNHEINFHINKGLTNADHPSIFKQEINNSPYFKKTTDQFKQYINDQPH
jgi:RHS repeat-associated protein